MRCIGFIKAGPAHYSYNVFISDVLNSNNVKFYNIESYDSVLPVQVPNVNSIYQSSNEYSMT